MWSQLLLTASATLLSAGSLVGSQDRPSQTGEVVPGRAQDSAEAELEAAPERPARIAWYPSLAQARAEAERTGRPILLQSAAPQCHGVPGMW